MDWNAEYSLFLYLSIYLTINKPKHISDFDTQTLNSTGDFYSSALTVLQKKVNEIKDSCYHLLVFIYFEPLNVRQRLDRNIFGENRLTDKI